MSATPPDEKLLLALGATPLSFDAGEKVFLEDDAGREMFLVRSGRVDIVSYGTVLENVRPGGVFGEMALIDGGQRSAAAIAVEATGVLAISKEVFLDLVRERPEFALHVMRQLSNRIRKMNKYM